MKYLAMLAAWGVFVVAVLLSLPAPAAAGGVIGSGPGTCTPAELSAKIAGGGLYSFNCGPGPVTIVLTGTLDLSRDTTLDGGGVITISGGHNWHVFYVETGTGLTLKNLTVADGRGGSGAGIYVFSDGRLTLVNTNFVGNQASFIGGAIVSNGPLTITGGLFYSNTANLNGGALDNDALAKISGATFLSNTSGTRGGAIDNLSSGILEVVLSRLQGNIAQGPGGAIYNLGILSLAQDTLANNSAQAGSLGGGLADFGTFADINSSTFVNNIAFGGGGVVLSDTQVYLEDTTFSANSSLGGAGALIETGQVHIDNITFYQNIGFAGAAIDVSGGQVFVENSILAGNPSSNCSGVLTSQGYNIDDGHSCMLSATGDMTTTNPLLGPLADNGGPTLTHALLPGSPAIHHGNRPYCQGLDQRGYVRGTYCDIGAFQVVFRVLAPLLLR